MIISPKKWKVVSSFRLDFECSNNQAEYEAPIIGLEILAEMEVSTIHIIGDSKLVIGQLSREFKWKSWELPPLNSIAIALLMEFDDVRVQHALMAYNEEADNLA